ncbi:MAG: HPr family phosphocarrier protein [Mycoplasma sp.]|nr:HPr family phosphocarrier protein [Mycoplasma sp.]
MKSFTAKIIDPVGLHARPASVTVSSASKFDSDITIESNGKKGNLKSIMNIMALGVRQDDEIIITANGSDEDEAITQVQKTMKENNLI